MKPWHKGLWWMVLRMTSWRQSPGLQNDRRDYGWEPPVFYTDIVETTEDGRRCPKCVASTPRCIFAVANPS